MQPLPPPSPPEPGPRLGLAMLIVAWLLLLLVFALFFDQAWQQKKGATTPEVTVINGVKQTILQRNEFNQYITQGSINGKKVLFLLDTGSTDVVIPGHIAKKLNLSQGAQSSAQTAGGKIFVYRTTIKKLVIGSIVLHNLPASINPYSEDEEILLGMTALKHIAFLQKGDSLILMPAD